MNAKTLAFIVGLWSGVVGLPVLLTGCPTTSGTGTASSSTASGSSSSGGTTTTSSSSSSSGPSAIQIITKGDSTGSFDSAVAPVSGGIAIQASRIYNLDGSVIPTSGYPTWFKRAKVFLTSTRTSAGTLCTTASESPCAYFDTCSSDNNPDSSGFYTIDGYNPTTTAADVDQCAGTAGAELSKVGMYIELDRLFMNSTDNLQLIVKAKPLDTPNTAPTASSCVVAGFFDASACSNQLFTVTMRTTPYAAAKPFYILFPSAKALDLLSESVLLPINISTSITTISIDRVKGGAILYGVTLVRLQ